MLNKKKKRTPIKELDMLNLLKKLRTNESELVFNKFIMLV